jgi:hypothetical protein
VPSELVGTFDFVVVDPPFITREVWELYAETVKLLLRSKASKILLTTIGTRAFTCLPFRSPTQHLLQKKTPP